MGSEDLEFCKFYKYIQIRFHHLYENAQERQSCICVPCNDSVLGADFDLNFVEYHILKPSPYFKGEYETSHLRDPGTLNIDGNYIETQDGFPEKIRVRILKEELGYNKSYQPYKILIIEKPLVPVAIDKARQERERSQSEPLRDLYLGTECQAFLESFPECVQVLRDLKGKLSVFTENYLVLPGYLNDAASRLRHFYTHTSQEFLDNVESDNKEDERFVNNTHRAIENVILHEAHTKVFGAVCKECCKAEEEFVGKLQTLHHVSPIALGVSLHVLCDMSHVIASFKHLQGLKTPLELLCHMKQILDSIVQTVNAHLTSQSAASKSAETSLATSRDVTESSQVTFITTDDVIPLLVDVIIRAGPSHLVSILHYIEHFHWSTSPADNLSYSLVTFQAATHYIQHLSLDQLPTGPDSYITQTNATEQRSQIEENKYTPSGQTDSRRDRQLDRINRMVHTSKLLPGGVPGDVSATGVVRPLQPLSMQRARSRQGQSSQLGSFLSSLKNDSMDCSFGKQT